MFFTGIEKNNLNYLQNKTARLYQIRRTYMRNVKCKNKNVLEVLKSSKYISLFEPCQSIKFLLTDEKKNLLTDEARRVKYISRILKLLERFYFSILHFLCVRRMWERRDLLFCK